MNFDIPLAIAGSSRAEPARDCPLCPRLVEYRAENARQNPDWWNGPAPSFGDPAARLMIAGLAPGRTGANRTGRPFTGDHAGWLLYDTLRKTGFAAGRYDPNGDDDLRLIDCTITNVVRCAPPQNKPETSEEKNCGPFFTAKLAELDRLQVIVTLGDVARRSVLRAMGLKASIGQPGHGSQFQAGPYTIINSYHCSRLNTNTGRLTAPMFEEIFQRAKALLK
ncbi:uracil-DNA glycosylase [Caulobacter mirabilis]|uniref:Type-5 uracil-DNA glycosylase n=1 Tax=Caulobacter mirabilis TaxID=69666 RepID=A0A2D2AXJ2_9CAUL|nr:uracil-DNA glycosylase [Caulobacter mirabilis]ATQ42729.1 uracil-DNA glycosylase [Caulobacter mirabilis]